MAYSNKTEGNPIHEYTSSLCHKTVRGVCLLPTDTQVVASSTLCLLGRDGLVVLSASCSVPWAATHLYSKDSFDAELLPQACSTQTPGKVYRSGASSAGKDPWLSGSSQPSHTAYLFTYHVRPSFWGSPLRQGTLHTHTHPELVLVEGTIVQRGSPLTLQQVMKSKVTGGFIPDCHHQVGERGHRASWGQTLQSPT